MQVGLIIVAFSHQHKMKKESSLKKEKVLKPSLGILHNVSLKMAFQTLNKDHIKCRFSFVSEFRISWHSSFGNIPWFSINQNPKLAAFFKIQFCSDKILLFIFLNREEGSGWFYQYARCRAIGIYFPNHLPECSRQLEVSWSPLRWLKG